MKVEVEPVLKAWSGPKMVFNQFGLFDSLQFQLKLFLWLYQGLTLGYPLPDMEIVSQYNFGVSVGFSNDSCTCHEIRSEQNKTSLNFCSVKGLLH